MFFKYSKLLESDSPETIMAFIQFRAGELKVNYCHCDNLRRKADKLNLYYLEYLENVIWAIVECNEDA